MRLTNHSIVVAGIVVGITCAGLSTAQQSQPAPPKQPLGVAMLDQPLRLEPVGLTLFVPEGAEAITTQMASAASAEIRDDKHSWVIRVKRVAVAKPWELTKAADEALAALLGRNAEGLVGYERDTKKVERFIDEKDIPTRATLLVREPAEGKSLLIPNGGNPMPIERFYVSMPDVHRNKPDLVQGYTLTQITPTLFVSFELMTNVDKLDHARLIYESVVAAARIEDPTNANQQRAAAVLAGQSLLKTYDAEKLAQIAAAFPDRWERLYRPGASGRSSDDTEVGFRRVRLEQGRRRDIETGVNPRNTARSEGLIARVDARFLDGTTVIDSESAFFVSSDRTEESWRVTMIIRDDKGTRTSSEIGARHGDAMTVRIDTSGAAPVNIRPSIAGDGYLSRADAYLLPHLLVRADMPAIYGFYVYNSQSQTIQFRSATLDRPTADEPNWRLITSFASTQPAQTEYFTKDGAFVRASLGNGLAVEPTTFDAVTNLWKSKNLPLD
jgi:hypothetical protein